MNDIELSKEISYALRHAPEKYELVLDEYGWTEAEIFILKLKEQHRFKDLKLEDVEKMIESSTKKRHELKNGKIRALYGHTIEKKICKDAIRPPDILYHGTAHKFVNHILNLGLLPQQRQYVHLSEDIETAIIVGKRRDDVPAILEVDAKQAWTDGLLFYFGNENVWLTHHIPAKYISVKR